MSLQLRAVAPERGLRAELTVGDGETVALLGPNGAGKSSMLALVAGLLRPYDGEVRLDDRPLTHVDHGRTRVLVPPHRRHVALLAQDPLLFPHLSARDNVAFGPRSRGTARRPARQLAEEWLQIVGAAELADRRPAQLSGGQSQRVALARAMAADPRLLLLDEPMAALDVAVAPALRQTLKQILKGRTAIVVTHDVLDALLLADRVVVVDGGEVVEEGPTSAVLSMPRSAFTARFAGLNMVRGTWREGAVLTRTGRRVAGVAAPPVPYAGAPAVAVFRPNAVSVLRTAPDGSPRNVFEVTVTELEPRGDQVRVRAGDLSADITVNAAAELDLAPGTHALFSVKATEIAVYAS